jgi:hypothetical protein
VFSNDGKKVVFTDEWGGGTSPNCQAMHPMEMGGNTTLVIGEDRKLTQHAYFKIPTAQSAQENCVSHNGGLIPVPGRDIMVQGWYQGGVNVIDFTDPDQPFEIAYFDRGPVDAPAPAGQPTGRSTIAGSWGAYWYNGRIYSAEMARGLDILELVPSEHLTENEIAAARLVQMREYNPQSQPKLTWPAAYPVVYAFLDQLDRGRALPRARLRGLRDRISNAQNFSPATAATMLTGVARDVERAAAESSDPARMRMLAGALRDLASVQQ